MTSSRVRLGQSFKTVGYGCASCWGDVGTGNVEVESYLNTLSVFSKRVQMTSSRVRLGQSFKTVGYGCASCWGDVGTGNVEADIFYILFIVSVQYIGY